jgi:hypothetical protein
MMWHFHASHNPDNPVFSFGVASGIARHFHPPMLRLLNVVATTARTEMLRLLDRGSTDVLYTVPGYSRSG